MDTNDLEHLFRKQVESVGALSGTFGRLSQQLAKQKEEEEKTRSAITKALGNVRSGWNYIKDKNKAIGHKIERTSESLSVLGKGADDALHAFEAFARGGVIGTIIGQMAGYFGDLTHTYKRMTEVGQKFEGSFFDMTRTAAQSGLTLDQFADMVEKNSTMLVQFEGGAKQFGKLTSSVRQATERFGMFGYSVDGLNELMGEYFETMRLGGRLAQIDQDRSAKHILGLAQNTSELAILFGKARKQITAESQQAQRNALLLTRRFTMTAEEQQAFDEKFGKTFDALAAQAGEAGGALSNMFAEIAGAGGSSAHSSIADQFRQAGLTEVPGLMEEAYARIAAGEDQRAVSDELITQIIDSAMGSAESLNAQIRAGNQNAEAVAKIISNMKKVDPAARKRAEEEAKKMEPLTKAMSNFENVWGRLTGMIRDKAIWVFEKLINGVTKGITTFDNNGGFQRIMNSFTEIGKAFSKWFTGSEVEDWGETFSQITIKVLGGVESFVTMIKEAVEKFTKNYSSFGEFFDKEIVGPFKTLAAILVGVAAGFVALKTAFEAWGIMKTGKAAADVLGALSQAGEGKFPGSGNGTKGGSGSSTRGPVRPPMGRAPTPRVGLGGAALIGMMAFDDISRNGWGMNENRLKEMDEQIDSNQKAIEGAVKAIVPNKLQDMMGWNDPNFKPDNFALEHAIEDGFNKLIGLFTGDSSKKATSPELNYNSPGEGKRGVNVATVLDEGDRRVEEMRQEMIRLEGDLYTERLLKGDQTNIDALQQKLDDLVKAIQEQTAIQFKQAQELIDTSRRSTNTLNNSLNATGR